MTTVRYLQAGDQLASGFVVTHRPYTSIRAPKGKLWVEGYYPGKGVTKDLWNASTTVRVVGRVTPAPTKAQEVSA